MTTTGAGEQQLRHITYVHIVDTFGVEEIEFRPGGITVVWGDNGTGKTSVRRAIGAVFTGGTDPSMIRQGAERSVIDIRLDDDTQITQVTRPKRNRTGAPDQATGYVTDIEIIQPDGTPLPGAPRTFLKRLARDVAIDPTILLKIDATTTAGMNKLAEEFLKLMPVEFSADEVRKLLEYQDVVAKEGPVSHYTGMKWVDHYVPAMAGTMPAEDAITLDHLKTIADEISHARTAIGRIAERSDAAVKRIRESLPPKDDADWTAMLAQERQHKVKIETAWRERKDEIEVAERDAIERARQITREALTELEGEARPLLEASQSRITEYETKNAMQLKAAGLRDEIEHQLVSGWSAVWKYDRLTDSLTKLDRLKKDRLATTSVQGVEVEHGTVLVDGIPWNNVNTAKRVEIVCEICSQLAGNLHFLMIDDANLLSETTMKMLQERLLARNFQVMMGIVSKAPLTVTTTEAGV